MNKVITTVLAALIIALVVSDSYIAKIDCDRHGYSRRN